MASGDGGGEVELLGAPIGEVGVDVDVLVVGAGCQELA